MSTGSDNGAARFLQRVVPWDGTNYVNIHHKYNNGMPGRAYLSVNEALTALNRDSRVDVYISMASHSEFLDVKDKNGRPYKKAQRLRTGVYACKALYADLDVKEGAYSSTADALKAISKFCETTSMPKPNVIVLSGTGGAHVYWTLDTLLSVDDWQPRANALSMALKACGVKFDSQCTVDPVRLLRVPGTLNGKQTPHLPVTLAKCDDSDFPLDVIDEALGPYFREYTPNTQQASENDELSAGIKQQAAKRQAEAVATACPQFRKSLTEGGAQDTEPVWFDMLVVAHYCESGEEVAHQLSSSHPGYHKDETDLKIETIKKDREARSSLGWIKCNAIAAHGASECVTCPLLAMGLSPLNHAKLPPPPEGAFPFPFFKQPGTGFVMRKGELTPDGKTTPDELICRYNMFDAWVSPGEWSMHFKFNTGGAGVQECTLRWGDTSSEQTLMRVLGQQGFAVTAPKRTREFMTSFMQQLQHAAETVANAQPFGWYHEDGVLDGFIYNGVRFTPDGNKRAMRAQTSLANIYTPTGGISPWLEAVRFVNAQRRPALDAIIASAFAAPLVAFAGTDGGFAMGGWEPAGGAGKSTALNIATTVWGHPQTGKMGLSDTEVYFQARAAALKNLPLSWDEIRGEQQQERFSKMLFELTAGKSRGRGMRNGSAAEITSIQTLLTYTLNVPMVDKIREIDRTTTAAEVRVFEFHVPSVDPKPNSDRLKELMVQLRSNYGSAGLRYAEWLGANGQLVHDEVTKLLSVICGRLEKAQDERFWLATITTLLLGAKYANKLGLTDFDVTGLREFLFAEFLRMQAAKRVAPNNFSTPESVAGTIANYLREKRARNTCFTDRVWLTKGKPGKGAINLIFDGPESTRIEAVEVHVAVEQRIIRLSESSFSAWLKRNEISRATMYESMGRLLSARRISGGVLAGGTRFAITGFKEPLWELTLVGTPLEDLVDFDTEP